MLILLHTCESHGTAKANADYLWRTNNPVHFVFDARNNDTVPMVPLGQPAKGLRNLPGGVETNLRDSDNIMGADIIQVELVGYAHEVAGYGEGWYANLRTFLMAMCYATGVPYTFPRRFPVNSFDAASIRFTHQEWNDPGLTGIIGHCHVPENDHWDPGPLDIDRLAIREDASMDEMALAKAFANITGCELDPDGSARVGLRLLEEYYPAEPWRNTYKWYPLGSTLVFIHQEGKMLRLGR